MTENNLIKKIADVLCDSARGHCNGDCEGCPCIKQAECLVKKRLDRNVRKEQQMNEQIEKQAIEEMAKVI